jgi:hypothetical protein
MREGGNPAIPQQRAGELRNGKVVHNNTRRPTAARSGKSTLNNLRRDPSLRFTEAGRILLRLLAVHTIDPERWSSLIDNVPAHCAGMVGDLARECAEAWHYVAQQVERRGRMSAERMSS